VQQYRAGEQGSKHEHKRLPLKQKTVTTKPSLSAIKIFIKKTTRYFKICIFFEEPYLTSL